MPQLSDVYPNSTADGRGLPYDIARFLRATHYTIAAGNTAALLHVPQQRVISVYSEILVAVGFDVDPLSKQFQSFPGGFVLANERTVFALEPGVSTLYIVPVSAPAADSIVLVQELGVWKAAAIQSMLEVR